MNLREKFKYEYPGNPAVAESGISEMRTYIENGEGTFHDHFFLVSAAAFYSLKCYVEGDYTKAKAFAETTVWSAVQYFHGEWRSQLPSPNGAIDPEYWKGRCLWYDEVARSLPFAAALKDWKSLNRIAEYPCHNMFPEAKKAKGEIAWMWALLSHLRNDSPDTIEGFLLKAENDKSKRPKLLSPILRAMIAQDAAAYAKTFCSYLEYYQKHETRKVLDKMVSLEGTLLFHLGRKRGLDVDLPNSVALHVIRFN